MPVLDTSLGPVAYDDRGAGPVVVLLHATLHDRSDYADVSARLADHRRVLALDWPGHGQSPEPASPHRLGAAHLAAVLQEFTHRLDLTNVVLVGNSVGGYAACRLAISDPQRVAGLVLVNNSGFTPSNVMARAYCRFMGRPWVIRHGFGLTVPAYMNARTPLDREITARVVARSKTPDGIATAAAMWRSFAQRDHDLRPHAAQITAPTLITWGTTDRTQLTSWGRAVHRHIAGSEFIPFDAGHLPFTSLPDAWLAAVLSFLQRVQPLSETVGENRA